MIKDKWLYLGVFVTGIFLLIRLLDQSKIMWIFPLDYANDHSAHIAKIFFLAKYGYGGIVPNWWGGFPLLKFYHPGSALFALPLYYLFNNPQIAEFVAILLIYLFGFITISYIGKLQRWSNVMRVAFFLFFFGNPLFIGYLRTGRFGEMFGFFWSILLFLIIIYYKDKKLDKKFLFFIPVYGTLLISHISVFMIYSSLIFALFLIKNIREKIYIVLGIAGSLIWTSFWWIPFISGIWNTQVGGFYGLKKTLLLNAPYTLGDRVTSLVVPIIFLTISYIYLKNFKINKKEIVFYSIPLILCLLFVTRIAAYIPFMNRPVPDTYNLYFLFLSLFLLFNLNIHRLSKTLKKLVFIGLVVLPILGVLTSFYLTPFFQDYGPLENEVVSVISQIDGKFIILGNTGRVYANAVYAYAAIKHNLYTPSGWGAESVPIEYKKKFAKIQEDLDNRNCEGFFEGLDYFGVTNLVAYKDCDKIAECGLGEAIKEKNICLFKI